MTLEEFRSAKNIPVGEVCNMVVTTPAVVVEEKEEKDDVQDDLEYTYELEADQLEALKEVYDFLDSLLSGVCSAKVDMPIELVRRMEVAIGDMHELINEFEEYKPEDAGIPCIAVTLEDQFRKDE